MLLEPGRDYVVRLGGTTRVLTLERNPHWQVKLPFILRKGEDLYYCDRDGTVDTAHPAEWRVLGVYHNGPVNVGDRIGFYEAGVFARGVVRRVHDSIASYAVEIDEDLAAELNDKLRSSQLNLHNCGGHIPSSRGWWVSKGAAIFDWSPASLEAEPPSPVPSPEGPNMYGFKVGDRVAVKTRGYEYTGTVLGAIPEHDGWIAVRPDVKPDGLLLHDCEGLSPDKRGRFEYHVDLTPISENTSSPKAVRTLNSEERAQIWAAFTHSNRTIEECVSAWDWLMNNS